jgi:hypothetical protein
VFYRNLGPEKDRKIVGDFCSSGELDDKNLGGGIYKGKSFWAGRVKDSCPYSPQLVAKLQRWNDREQRSLCKEHHNSFTYSLSHLSQLLAYHL